MDVDDPEKIKGKSPLSPVTPQTFGMPPLPVAFWQRPEQSRPKACVGCHSGCRSRYETGLGNESSCVETEFYTQYDLKKHSGILINTVSSMLEYIGKEPMAFGIRFLYGKQSNAAYIAADMLQKYGINAYELYKGIPYIRDLNKMGVLGPGRQIECDLPFDKLGEVEFIEKLIKMIAFRKGVGNDMAEGFFRAAKRWGRLEEDLKTGLLSYPYWGLPEHNYDPRVEVEWGYGSILGDRDINEHDFNFLFWMPSTAIWEGKEPAISAREAVTIVSEKLKPYEGNPLMLDYSDENIYSEHMAKLVTWHRHYSRFWKQSVLYCDLRFADFINTNAPDNRGLTGEGEHKFFNAVTGKHFSFEDGMELGRKIWNLDNAIWTLQGRHRDMVHFSDYIYTVPYDGWGPLTAYYMPGKENGEWKYIALNERHLDRTRFEEWKTTFYILQGWAPDTGWPVRSTLEDLGLKNVADDLEKENRLGRVSI
jgi:aldehyde:ferredoxin oxidoreductase